MKEKIIQLRTGRRGRLKPGHPWIYRGQILKTLNPSIKAGDIVSILNPKNEFVGRGYYNPKSKISIRLLTFTDEKIDEALFFDRIKSAAKKRYDLFAKTNAYRAFFSEADGLPGLVIDVYNDTAVFQVTTLGMEKFKKIIVQCIKDALNPKYIYERSDSPSRKLEGLKDLKAWHGAKGSSLIEIFEGKALFFVDIENGHKTGFYLDQRPSRLAIGAFSNDKKVLDLFCYTGGFSIHAALAGAREVRGVDVKRDWLILGRKNAILNGVADKIDFAEGDAFSVLRNIYKRDETFDIIVIDPPSFLRHKRSLASATKGYEELNSISMKILTNGGVLATYSCSHNMPWEAFSDMLKRASERAKKQFRILKRCHQAEDHPISRACLETEYLKGYFLKV